MGSEGFNRNLEMVNAGCFSPEGPLTTKILLVFGDQSNACLRFYGKVEDKKKVYRVIKANIHSEVHAKRGHLKCHCSLIPKMRLSKTARNLNKVFLTCSAPATSESRCKYFQWIHTPPFIDRRPRQSGHNKRSRTLSNGNAIKHGWISLLKPPKNKTNNGKPRKKQSQAIRGRKPCQVPFTGVLRLQRRPRNKILGKRFTALPTVSLKPASIVPSRNGARYQPVMWVTVLFTEAENQRQTDISRRWKVFRSLSAQQT